MSLLDGFKTLGRDVNKVTGEVERQPELLPELTLEMEDSELISLKDNWLKSWTDHRKKLFKKQEQNEEYWLGKQFGSDESATDNLIFESLETFLPIATSPKPEPIVEAEGSEEAREMADKVRKMLAYKADTLSLNIKLKQTTRYWALYFLGAVKVGWSDKENDITCYVVRPQKLILDPEATIEDGWYTGEYIGEEKSDKASDLIIKFPNSRKYIESEVKKKLGTRVTYHEWWTDDYVFWTYKKEVLGKAKNPHWNYETEEPMVDEMGQPMLNEMGEPEMDVIPGRNHFNLPQKPYMFLSVFNLGKHPHDDTSLITQNIPLQDLVNKRIKQIDRNADNANSGLKVSGDYFSKAQAQEASEALRKGKAIWVPTGDVNAAISRDNGTPLPQFVYESLLDYRSELRNVFGTRGSSPQGTMDEQTVRGKIITRGQDADRIGGGVSVFLEQLADNIFNWFVQLMYVYYDEEHTAIVLGKEQSREYISLKNSDLPEKLLVGVKDGSMIPKDPLSKRNEAVDLWGAGALDPITLYDRLEFPNPRESAKQLVLWKVDPIQLFPDLMAEQQAQQQAQLEAEQQLPANEPQAEPDLLNEVPIQ